MQHLMENNKENRGENRNGEGGIRTLDRENSIFP